MDSNTNLQDNSDILQMYENDITNLVKIWISGDYKHTHLFEKQIINNLDMIETKKYFYNLIMAELKKQLKTNDCNKIMEHLNGEFNVFFDEVGILACINSDSYFQVSDYECEYDDNDDY